MATNEHHEWLKKRDWPSVQIAMFHSDRDLDLIGRKYKERDEHGRLPHHWMAAKAQTHTHALAEVGVESIGLNYEALTTRDKEGKTPIDIAQPVLRSRACSPSLPEARSLGSYGDGPLVRTSVLLEDWNYWVPNTMRAKRSSKSFH